MNTTNKQNSVAGPLNGDGEARLALSKMITRKEVADYLKVSVQSVINYTNRGLLTSYKIGRRVLYNEAEVAATLQSRTVQRYQHESTTPYIFKK